MAKKNAKFSDPSTSSVLLDGRTGAVMANSTYHQDEIKHKVQAVREVVPSRSNNDIILVLQYYDLDLEQTIQAFLEDGAKEALNQWKFSGNKTVTKKKKKNKTKGKDVTTLTTTSTTVTTATSTLSAQYGTATTTTTTKGAEPYVVSDSLHKTQDFSTTNGHNLTSTRSNGYHNGVVLGNSVVGDLTTSDFTLYKGLNVDVNGISGTDDGEPLHDNALSISSAASTLSSLSTSVESSPVNNHIPQAGKTDVIQPHSSTVVGKTDLQPHSIVNNHVTIKSNQSAKQQQQQQKKSRSKSRDKVATVTEKEGNVSKSRGFGSPALSRKAEGLKLKVGKADDGKHNKQGKGHVKSHSSEPVKSHSSSEHTAFTKGHGSEHSKGHAGDHHHHQSKSHMPDHSLHPTARPKTLEGKTRERTVSEVSMSSVTTTSTITGDNDTKLHKDHRGLEKSMKDLQRQMTSLQRHRNILAEDCDKSQKQIAKVFEQLRDILNEREAQLMLKMDHLKTQATEILSSRQQQGLALKARTELAFKMSDHELVELRADIKHFVSDRKVDEDIASQKKSILDLEKLQADILNFGEISELKHNYSTRRPSLSSSISSTVTDPLSPLTPQTPYTPSPMLPPTPANLLPVPKSSSTTSGKNQQQVLPSATKMAPPPVVHAPLTMGAKVVSQSDSLTKFEISGEMQTLLQSRKDKPSQLSSRRSQTPAGRGRSQGKQSQSARGGGGANSQAGSRGNQSARGGGAGQGRGQGSRPQQQQPGDVTDDSTTSEDKRVSRNVRRRQRQRERQKEKREQQKSEESAADTKEPSQGQAKVADRSLSPRKEGQGQQYRRNYRTPSPTKRNPQMKGPPKDGSGDGSSHSNHSKSIQENDKKPVANSQQQQQPRSGPRSPVGRGGRGTGRGGQRSKSMDQQYRGRYQGDKYEKQKPEFSKPANKNVAIPENKVVDNDSKQEAKASEPDTKDQSESQKDSNVNTASNTTNVSADNTVAKDTTVAKDSTAANKEAVVSVETTTSNKSSVEKMDNELTNGLTNGVNLNQVDNKPDLMSSNNNNNKNVDVKNHRNVNINDHYYDKEDVENCNVSDNKVINDMQIEEHIYDEALPQRKPRNRASRTTQHETKVSVTKQEVTVTEEVVTQQEVVTVVTQEVKVNGAVNGVHRWSDEELEQNS